eukprot:143191-Hanusia_phi.AAC.1
MRGSGDGGGVRVREEEEKDGRRAIVRGPEHEQGELETLHCKRSMASGAEYGCAARRHSRALLPSLPWHPSPSPPSCKRPP